MSSQNEAIDVSLPTVQRLISRHLPMYERRPPAYHAKLLEGFTRLWDPTHERVLDVGGGTGIIAQAMKELFRIEHVTSIDVEQRFLRTLDIETSVYDGVNLPFADASFDCITFSNVLHHVPVDVRPRLMKECARVVGSGPIYIKDHLAASALDHGRLFVLDAMGNLPLKGMVKAQYLGASEWQALATDAGYRVEQQISGEYRKGLFRQTFPNRLEVSMKLVRNLA
jgi:ubiquinone/menaquinone biosynthesis C-methylase UbiE